MKQHLLTGIVAASLLAASGAYAQTKQELVQQVIQIQQPSIEGLARSVVEEPAMQISQISQQILQTQIPEDKREALAKSVSAEIQKYVNEATPLVRDRALKLAPTTVGPLLESNFTEDELKQLIAWLQSPVNKKYGEIAGQLQNALLEKVVNDSRAQVDPKIATMEQNVGKLLGVRTGPAGNAAPANGAASKPAAPVKK
ncbi:hypothetical protein EC845_1747 [Comamonas sp. BIGb0124]|uniref:DUF2059 domain-containing protein n=1 Tax=Comamonas sp. BIGb0124 TaxID=2485130 RepID=UPI000F4AC28D|nr:DUF2059 domain-containing protein [Comamonas sp. BIGb0124]ROR22840.1 hypothetical protein EC845_1747 [Comamonas sp. BIGb0124]